MLPTRLMNSYLKLIFSFGQISNMQMSCDPARTLLKLPAIRAGQAINSKLMIIADETAAPPSFNQQK